MLSSLLFIAGSLNTLLQLAEFAFTSHRLVEWHCLGKLSQPPRAIGQLAGNALPPFPGLCQAKAAWAPRCWARRALTPLAYLWASCPVPGGGAVLVSAVLLSGLCCLRGTWGPALCRWQNGLGLPVTCPVWLERFVMGASSPQRGRQASSTQAGKKQHHRSTCLKGYLLPQSKSTG